MKKLLVLLAAAGAAVLLALPCAAVGPAAASEAYCVMDADTGQVLLSQNADEELDPASVTKIMTLGMACEAAQGSWDVQLTVSHDDVHTLAGTDSSHIALQEGEVVTLRDMLYATAVSSANDAANVLAEYFGGGTIAGGVDAMNAKAQALGLQHTHFANPHGISEEGHYLSAGDLAVILRWALQQPGFADLFSRYDYYEMAPTNLQPVARQFWLQDHMRMPASLYYIPEITGSKIGYTNTARYTYACLAEKDGVRLICTVLKSQLRTDKYNDVAALLSYSFSHFVRTEVTAPQPVTVSVQGGGEVLGTLSETAPAVSLLLDSSLGTAGVQCVTAQVSYTLGSSVPQVQYALDGGGVQENDTLTVALQLDGLSALLEARRGEQLPAENAEQTRALHSAWLWCAAAAAVGAGALLFCRSRQKAAAARKKGKNGCVRAGKRVL